MRRICGVVLAGALGALALVAPAEAQTTPPSIELRPPAPGAPPPPAELGIEPTVPPDQRGRGEDPAAKPGLPATPHEPAFIRPAVTTIPITKSSGIRMGLSGWTASPLPVDNPERTGGFAFGLTILWGVPVAPSPPATEEPPPEPR
jgi:hypothetical protein